MTTQFSSTEKYLVNCQEGKNNIERASISFVLAATASKTCETVVFLTADASIWSTKGGADYLQHDGMEPISDLINQFIGNGGKIWLCPICAKVRGIAETDLIEGAEIAGAPKSMAFLESGARLLA
jgi:predicted peroxiredoxin